MLKPLDHSLGVYRRRPVTPPLGYWLGCLAGLVMPSVAAAAAGPVPSVDDLLQMPFQDVLAVRIRSAGKREEEIRDIPASVTIVTREDIERYGWVTFEELLRNVPGFYLLDNTEDRFIGTRGAVGGGVQFLVNGIPQHPSLQKTLTATEIARLDIPVESIDRVEIIRGPMSVIYGNNAFQGVINVVTNQIGQSGPRASASLGSGQSGRLFGRVGTVFEDGFVVLNAGGYQTGGLTGAYADMMGPRAARGAEPRHAWQHRRRHGPAPGKPRPLCPMARLAGQCPVQPARLRLLCLHPALRRGHAHPARYSAGLPGLYAPLQRRPGAQG
jgi:outer membrane receptor protein involved in Fe transport